MHSSYNDKNLSHFQQLHISISHQLNLSQLQKKWLDGRTDATWANSRQIKASPKCVESDGWNYGGSSRADEPFFARLVPQWVPPSLTFSMSLLSKFFNIHLTPQIECHYTSPQRLIETSSLQLRVPIAIQRCLCLGCKLGCIQHQQDKT